MRTPYPRGLEPLQGRVLLQISANLSWWVEEHVEAEREGLVLVGPQAYKKARNLRRRGFHYPLLVDPGLYQEHPATEERPFPVPVRAPAEEAAVSLFEEDEGNPLERSLQAQRAAGVTAAMTPSGYVRAEDSEALIAMVEATIAHGDPAVILVLPLDVTWFRDDANTATVIAALQMYKGPKAIMLGGQMDPLSRFKQPVTNLCKVLTEVEDCSLMRADLAAFGALAHGAAFASIGATSSMRHIVPPGAKAQTGGGAYASSPHVLHHETLGFYLGSTLQNRFAGARAPICDCTVCEERGLDRFLSRAGEDLKEAAAHNIEILRRLRDQLMAQEPGLPRQRSWRESCQQVQGRCESINAELRVPKGFSVPKQVALWAALPLPEQSEAATSAKAAGQESS
ncbi:hypothetical protein [Nocardiopsis metallicus]|uniref:tRNA-guanine(15) transglycosylase-like domain-containing protein n=1 Tax=Nocardiopsis metallicus TaxID=179819 RepID=A0A840WSZ1_9ACTN|nr:hypothetical protein [Nocardiopsis metallicus]MBB5494677.1 hypothetical protein [Nocardiopsis metallicus]